MKPKWCARVSFNMGLYISTNIHYHYSKWCIIFVVLNDTFVTEHFLRLQIIAALFTICLVCFLPYPFSFLLAFVSKPHQIYPSCLEAVTRCLQRAAAAAGGPSAQTESAGGIKGPSPKKATGVGLHLVCSPRCWVTSDLCANAFSRCLLC